MENDLVSLLCNNVACWIGSRERESVCVRVREIEYAHARRRYRECVYVRALFACMFPTFKISKVQTHLETQV